MEALAELPCLALVLSAAVVKQVAVDLTAGPSHEKVAAPPAIPPPPGLSSPVPARSRHAAVEDVGRACDALELCTVCRDLTDALRGVGLRCAAGGDIVIEKWQDLFRPAGQAVIFRRVRASGLSHTHVAPPCKIFSRLRLWKQGRTAAQPLGDDSDPVEADGNAHAGFCVRLILACMEHNVLSA